MTGEEPIIASPALLVDRVKGTTRTIGLVKGNSEISTVARHGVVVAEMSPRMMIVAAYGVAFVRMTSRMIREMMTRVRLGERAVVERRVLVAWGSGYL